jgi:peptidoglycan/xylan/chitin deacetylase (PgdA/CDA1 family)
VLTTFVLAAIIGAFPPAAPDRRPVPILMYHVIAAPPAGARYPGLYVRPAEFAGEVQWLARNGYRAVTLERVWNAWHGLGRLPRRPVVLTFDDGYRSDFTNALPILRRLRWPGVLNLEVANTRPVWGTRPGEVEALVDAHWEIDAHTLTHPDLTRLSPAEVWRQVDGSRLAIRREFHVPVEFFCYPSGRFDREVEQLVRRAGFDAATTTVEGLARPSADPYALDRVRVTGGLGAFGLAATLRALHA